MKILKYQIALNKVTNFFQKKNISKIVFAMSLIFQTSRQSEQFPQKQSLRHFSELSNISKNHFRLEKMADAQKGPSSLNYDEEKNKLKRFLAEFHTKNDRGQKEFVYARQLTNIAHREQVNLTLDLDHVAEFDPELADAIRNNTRRFITLASEAVWDLLPDYREHDPPARDALDVYINHRTLMEARTRNPGDNRPAQNAFPPELMRRFI